MSFKEIIGHERPVRILKGALRGTGLAHAYLFHGEEGIGKQRVARALAQTANCPDAGTPPAGEACGECPSCRAMAAGTHPDLLTIAPDGAVIKIHQVRELQQKMTLRPMSAACRFVIFNEADALNQEAANALLKSLEEPPPQTVLILITARPHALLPTVVSRCQPIRFSPLTPAQVASILKEKQPGSHPDLELIGDLALGRVGPALSWNPEALKREWGRFGQIFQAERPLPAEELMQLAQTYSQDRKQTEQALQWLGLRLRGLLREKVDPAGQRTAADGLTPETICALARLIQWTWTALNRNINRLLVLETLLLQIRRAVEPKTARRP